MLVWSIFISLLTSTDIFHKKPPSFIDFNTDKSYEQNMNQGLGTEKLIYQDSDILVYDKPTLAQTAPGYLYNDSLALRVQNQLGIERFDQMIVHRLDYATSGIVIFALNLNALRNLHTQFRNHNNMYKRYVAIVNGSMNSLEGDIDLPLGKDEVRGPPLQCVRSDGRPSRTTWTVRGMKNGVTMLDLIPKTGR
jgi:tRNA pseudouridine32 synthase/23S rRNA pseudouridine746 synthase